MIEGRTSNMIEATLEEVAAAFEAWLTDLTENPDDYSEEYGEPKTYGEWCAANLARLLS